MVHQRSKGNILSQLKSKHFKEFNFQNKFKAPQSFVKQPIQITNNLEGFQLQYKISELSFKVEKSRFHDTRGQIKLQCVAKIERLPSTAQPVIRETSTYINLVTRGDDLKNQKLIDSGETDATY